MESMMIQVFNHSVLRCLRPFMTGVSDEEEEEDEELEELDDELSDSSAL